MRESLREFIYREAGPDEASRLDLMRHLAPSVFIAGGYDFNELRQLIQYGPGLESSSGSEYVADAWPEVPVADPLPCITIRPFKPDGYTTTPYELVALLAWHLRDLLVGAETAPDFDGIIRYSYIAPENMDRWREAAERWRAVNKRTAQRPGGAQDATVTKRKGWKDFAWAHVVAVQRTGRYSTAKLLHEALWNGSSSNADSPFEARPRKVLALRETGKTLDVKTLQNDWSQIRTAANKG